MIAPSGYFGDGQDAPLAGGVNDSMSTRPDILAGGKKSVLHVDLIKAKDLIKADMIGKSDPYAVLKYGDQQVTTPVIINSQNPKWDHSADFAADPQDNDKLM